MGPYVREGLLGLSLHGLLEKGACRMVLSFTGMQDCA